MGARWPASGDHLSTGRQSGAVLIVTCIALTVLLGVAAIALLSSQTEVRSSGHARFNQVALYAAESGAAAAMDYLRTACIPGGMEFFTRVVSPSNNKPYSPLEILGNKAEPSKTGNPFQANVGAWYEITILNNWTDPGFADGKDLDAIVVLHVVGHGPDRTQVTLEVEVQNNLCVANFCLTEYAQKAVSSRNDGLALCEKEINAVSGVRYSDPSGGNSP